MGFYGNWKVVFILPITKTRAYSFGNGTPRSFWRRLNERTVTEMQIYERTRRELEKEKSYEIWEQKNDALRHLGLRTIPYQEE